MVGGFPQRRPAPPKVAEVPKVDAKSVEFDEEGRRRITSPITPAPVRPAPTVMTPPAQSLPRPSAPPRRPPPPPPGTMAPRPVARPATPPAPKRPFGPEDN